MQLIAESYDLLRRVGGPRRPPRIADVFAELERGRPRVVPDRDHRRGAPPGGREDRAGRSSTSSLDQAGSKGTGVWTVQNARRARRAGRRASPRRSSPAPSRASPTSARRSAPRSTPRPEIRSRRRRLRGRRPRRRSTPRRSSPTRRASTRSSPAPRSTAGTSTRAPSPGSGAAAASSAPSSSTASSTPTRSDPDLATLLEDAVLRRRRRRRRGRVAPSRRRSPRCRASRSPGSPRRSAYYDSLASERLPAALIQGQRDFFGAHTYRRTDGDGVFHTLWSGDRSEVAIERTT